MLFFNVEDRFMTPWRFWFFNFGPVIFYDGGMVWQEGEDPFRKQVHHSAGIGLRIENTKQQGAGITRLDIAYNFDRGAIAQIIFTSGHLVKAHYGLNAYSPSLLLY
jgi:hemolysin activation/secretion protein